MKQIFYIAITILLSTVKLLANDEKVNIALLLTDTYHLLGEGVAKEAQKSLLQYNVEANIKCYYYSDFDNLTYDSLKDNQLIFIDIINPTKVAGVLPLLNRLAKVPNNKVLAIGSDKAAELGENTDILLDKKTINFYEYSGHDNLVAMILDQCQRSLGFDIPEQAPIPMPEFALCNVENKKVFDDFEAYRNNYAAYMEGNPWVAINIWRSDFLSEQLLYVKEYITQFEDNGFNVLCYYGFPTKDDIGTIFYTKDKKLVPGSNFGAIGLVRSKPKCQP